MSSLFRIPWLCKLIAYVKWYGYLQFQHPFAVEIETMGQCNRKCVYCPVSTENKRQGQMSEEMFHSIIDSLGSVAYRGRVSFHFFNEPLLDKRIDSFIRYASHILIKANIVLVTNGDLLSEKRFYELVDNGIDELWVSVHDKDSLHKIEALINRLDVPYRGKIKVERVWSGDKILNTRGGMVDIPGYFGSSKKLMRQTMGCAALMAMDINYMGQVALCCNDFTAGAGHGELSGITAMELWKMSRKKRRDIYLGRWEPEICRNCESYVDIHRI